MKKAMDKVNEAKEMAVYNFNHGLSCSESTFEALTSTGILSEEEAPYATVSYCAGFGGGIGLCGLTCGALSAAVMAVGARHGRKDPKNAKPDGLYDVEYRRYNNILNEFKTRMASALCSEITKPYHQNWTDPGRKSHCSEAVQLAVEIACKYIDMTSEEVMQLPLGSTVNGSK